MLKSVEGIYCDGKIDLLEQPDHIEAETRVIVTFLDAPAVELQDRGIDSTQAARLRAQFNTFADDWDSPEMHVYDNYDAAASSL